MTSPALGVSRSEPHVIRTDHDASRSMSRAKVAGLRKPRPLSPGRRPLMSSDQEDRAAQGERERTAPYARDPFTYVEGIARIGIRSAFSMKAYRSSRRPNGRGAIKRDE